IRMTSSRILTVRRGARRGLGLSLNSRGIVTGWVVVALVALLGAAALAIDIGSLVVAAQRCQDVADSAALAAAASLPGATEVRTVALETVSANNTEALGWQVTCSEADVQMLSPGEVVSNEPLGPFAYGVEVTVHAPVDFGFARVLGLEGVTAHRSAVAVRGMVDQVPICPMWIDSATELNYGVQQELLMADGPSYEGIPGSFGFLSPPDGCTASWFELLEGYGLSEQDYQTSFVSKEDTLTAYTGVNVGGWVKALSNDKGCSRLERATDPDGNWADDTFEAYQPDNPRILLVPLVNYIGDSGTNATFEIVSFAAFWLEDVDGTTDDKKIIGRFIDYFDLAGGDVDSGLTDSSGLFAVKLVQ
ncbi:MAG: pilus assembly protein TadG-related protein, partial [Armatimonadota bacterium]